MACKEKVVGRAAGHRGSWEEMDTHLPHFATTWDNWWGMGAMEASSSLAGVQRALQERRRRWWPQATQAMSQLQSLLVTPWC